jgi:phasin
MTAMIEATPTTTVKSKPKPATSASGFELPKFDIPSFEMPKMEVPAAFREFAEKGIAQCKDSYDKMKCAAEEATDVLEDTYATASKGASGYGLKLLETARTNSNAAYELFGEILGAKSYAEVVELSTAYMREQFDTMTVQAKELAEHAQKVATETAEPIKESLTGAFSKAA